MAASASGIATLLAILLIGPSIYLSIFLYEKFFRKKTLDDGITSKEDSTTEDETSDGTDAREEITSSQYLFALIGYAIGISNIWRFPYVIAKGGGAAALLANILSNIFVVAPLFLYELIVGQHCRLSTMRTYEMIRPRWKSLGYASALMLFIVNGYFSMVVAYTLPYIVSSCQNPLPWEVKGSEEFWRQDILNEYEDLNAKGPGLGPIQPQLAGALLFFWALMFMSLAWGRNILAKITYVTVLLPVALLIILVIRTPMLPGASDGIKFYMGKFDASQLRDVRVWSDACSQVIFSLSPGFGTAITFSSYTRPKEDVYKICLITVIANSLFSIVGGFAIFSIVGNLAYEEGISVEEVAANSGVGLAFITIARGMTFFGQGKNVMSVIFFVMLLMLGLDSSYAWTETLVSYVEDFIEERGWKTPVTWKTTLSVAIAQFLFGLMFATRVGGALLDTIDHFIGAMFLLLLCAVEGAMFRFDFGWRRMAMALKKATYGNPGTPNGRNLFPTWLCRIDFHLTVPIVPLLLGISLFVTDVQDPYGAYPTPLVAVGWTLLALCITTSLTTLWKCDESKLPPLELLEITESDRSDNGVEDVKDVEDVEDVVDPV